MEKKGTAWEIIKFMVVSGGVGILQLLLANVLPLIFDNVVATVPPFLQGIFNPEAMFNRSTAQGAAAYSKYVVDGVITWGYVLPFFLSNLLANIYGYFQNRKTTFKSNSSPLNVFYYIVILLLLILFTTWLQGVIVGKLNSTGIDWLTVLSRTIASILAGFVQAVILFPLEKFVLMKKKM